MNRQVMPGSVAGTISHQLQATSLPTKQNADRAVRLACRQFWKLYGAQAQRKFRDASELRDLVEGGRAFGALQDVELEIGEGEIFVIMGLSGSGKSTLLRCLSSLIEPSFGEVLLDGRPLTELSAADLMQVRRHEVGMVFQHFALLPHLSVTENIALPLRIRHDDPLKIREVVADVVQLVGLAGMEDRRPVQLSGGQQQRVGLARALVVKPGLLFLDEPFSALDPLIRRELQDELLRLQARLKKTMVFVTHDFSEAVRLGDRIAIMKDGRVKQVGTPEEIVIAPADDYVHNFVAGVDLTRVVSCARIAAPASQSHYEHVVLARQRIAEAAEYVARACVPVGVQDGEGKVVGELDAAAILSVVSGDLGGVSSRGTG
ncbi:ATP-binding cassette domain-containing protein [Mesorhizobium sp. M0204]|uniref:ATP-binding cassette domain-containing protein n=1 Tax=Mesorhizobium sp. M0204 TaxID=2956913 RepID=UPI00333E0F28